MELAQALDLLGANRLASASCNGRGSDSGDRDRGSIRLACTLYADYAGEGTWSVSRAGAGLKYIHGPAISLRTPKEHPSPRK